jgi:hypothetical protein
MTPHALVREVTESAKDWAYEAVALRPSALGPRRERKTNRRLT